MEVKNSEMTQQKAKQSTLASCSLNEQSKADLLRGLYWDLLFSSEEIAEILQMSSSTVVYYMKKYDIPRRLRSDAISVAFNQGKFKNFHKRGREHPNWRGGRTVKGDGHILIKQPQHPRANHNGYVYEHILIWEKAHSKPLPVGYIVHHLNGIPSDNRTENLRALPDLKHKTVLAAKAQRIKELESRLNKSHQEIESLRRAMLDGQLSFGFDGRW